MENPLKSLPVMNPRVAPGTFSRGFISGAGSGALMMSIFYTGMLTAGLATFGLPMLMSFGIGVMSTGIFSGIMASKRSLDSLDSARTVSHEVSRREPVRAPEQSVAMAPVPAVMASRAEETSAAPTSQWQDRVSPNGAARDRISQIIADGSLSDKDRASAILAEREATQGQHAAR